MKPPIITAELRQAVRRLEAAQRYTATVRPIVNAYTLEILTANVFSYRTDDPGFPVPTGRITDPEDDWMIDDTQAQIYYGLLDEAASAHDFQRAPGCCPLLTAEHEERNARWSISDAAEYIAHTTRNRLTAANKLTEYTDLLVKLVNAA